jgi:ribose-phosphate pyrophosphokinase
MRTIINLDEKFTPFNGGSSFRDVIDFPSGIEPHIKLKDVSSLLPVVITARVSKMEDLFRLLLTVDALNRLGVKDITCFIPFLPFARQDRVMVEGEPFSLKVIANIINSMNLSSVYFYDVHSDASTILVNNSKSITNHLFVQTCLEGVEDYMIVSPDAGAYKKIYGLCKFLGYTRDIVLCNKVRDLSSGQIKNIDCGSTDVVGKDLYIIDDICDGGGTFTLLSDKLRERGAKSVNLIVSHGIFSKGVDALYNIDRIYTTNSFKDLEPNDKLIQVKLNQTLI